MCHLILLLPLVTLPIFWLLPLSQAIPIYAVGLVLAGWVYAYAIKAMRLPLVSEDAQLQGAIGRVVAIQRPGRCRVELAGESWSAECAEVVQEGDAVCVKDRDGLTLHVAKV